MFLATNNEHNKVKAAAKCLQMKNMTRPECCREVVQKTECSCLTCASPVHLPSSDTASHHPCRFQFRKCEKA